MMYIKGPNEVYFIDRDNAVFQIKGLTFPHRKDRSRHLVDTLLDGEMVIDVVGEAKHPRYLIYDFVSFEGNQICHDEFKKRYPAIQVGTFTLSSSSFTYFAVVFRKRSSILAFRR